MSEEFGDQDFPDVQKLPVPGGKRAARAGLRPMEDLPPLAEICAALKELQAQRMFCIRLQSKCDRATEAYVARALGYHSGMPKTERTELFAAAATLRRQVERGDEDQNMFDAQLRTVRAAVAPLIIVAAQGRAAFDRQRISVEGDMKRLARLLSVWPLVAPIRGFGELGLAIIVGEAGGDLAEYTKVAGKRGSGVAKLWKRLGLAVVGEVRQGGLPKNSTADEWIQHGYSPARRAQLWVIGTMMLRHQWRRPDKEAPGFPVGPYGEHYARKKAEYLAREWTPLHAERAAVRYMTKCLVRDLWGLWRLASARAEDSSDEREGAN